MHLHLIFGTYVPSLIGNSYSTSTNAISYCVPCLKGKEDKIFKINAILFFTLESQ